MKKLNFLGAVLILALTACNPYGKKHMVGQVELFVKSSISAEQTQSAISFMNEIGYNNSPVSAQLDKEGDTYLVRFVIQKDQFENPELLAAMQILKTGFSEKVFAKGKVRIDLCDENFKTVKSL